MTIEGNVTVRVTGHKYDEKSTTGMRRSCRLVCVSAVQACVLSMVFSVVGVDDALLYALMTVGLANVIVAVTRPCTPD